MLPLWLALKRLTFTDVSVGAPSTMLPWKAWVGGATVATVSA